MSGDELFSIPEQHGWKLWNESIMKPVRIQLSRKKGFRLTSPNEMPVVVVSRPSAWGNPYKVGEIMSDPKYKYINGCGEKFELRNGGIWISDSATAVRAFRHWLSLNKEGRDRSLELRGKNLACWCPLWDRNGLRVPCHADILLALANENYSTPTRKEEVL